MIARHRRLRPAVLLALFALVFGPAPCALAEPEVPPVADPATPPAPPTAPEPAPEPRPTTLVERVAVTATRSPQRIQDTPGAVSVVDAADIEDQGMADTRDLVRFEPGVYVEGDPTRLGPSGFNIRGIGGNRVMTLIDGVQTAEQFEFGPLAVPQYALDLDSVERVEFVRSAGSALYGSDALGGVVSFRTKDPRDYLARTERDAYVGLRGGYDGRDQEASALATVALRHASWEGLLQVTRREGHERDNQGHLATADASRTRANPQDLHSTGVLGKWVRPIGDGGSIEVGFEHFAAEADTELFSAQGPASPSLTVDDFDARDTHERSRLGVEHTLRHPRAAYDEIVWRAYFQRSATEERTLEQLTRTAGPTTRNGQLEFDQDTLGGEIQLSKRIGQAQRLTYGASVTHDTFDQLRDRAETLDADGSVVASPLVYPTKYAPESRVIESALYVQDDISLAAGRVRVIPGLRLDRYAMNAQQDDPIFLSGNPGTAPPVDLTDTALSPRLGVVGQTSSRTSTFVQYARGFRAPPYSSVNNGFTNPAMMYRTLPNPDLRPETGDSVEVGFRAAMERGSASVVLFDNRYDDFIETVATLAPDGFTEFQPQNIDKVKIVGVELGGDGHLGRGFSLRGAAAYVRGTNEVDGQPLESIAPPRVVGGVAYRPFGRRWTAELTTTFVGAKSSDDVPQGSTQFRPSSYQVVDLAGSWRPMDRLRLNFGLLNLGDEKYWSWSDVRGQIQGSASIDRYSSPGRSAWMNVRYEF